MSLGSPAGALPRWLLLYNRAAGQKDREAEVERLAAHFAVRGIVACPESPPSAGATTARAREASESGEFSAIVAFGGDGTAAIVAAGMLGTGVPLGVLPGGTANVLALELGLGTDPLEAASRLAAARPRPFDVGRANGRPFLLMCGAGLDAEVMRDVPSWWKRRLGRGAIALTTIAKLAAGRFPRFEVEIDPLDGDGCETLEGAAVVVSNGRFYGGPHPIAPGADFFDGQLDVVVFAGGRRRDFARYLAAIPRGAHVRMADVAVRRARSLRIRSAGAGTAGAAQLDGDYAFDVPVEVSIEPAALRMLVP